jgi:hypothetical protein
LEVRNSDFLDQFTKIKILPVFKIKQTTKISKMFVKIFNDFWQVKIQISYFFQIKRRRAPCQHSKKQVDSKLANCLNITKFEIVFMYHIVFMYTHTDINFPPSKKKVCALRIVLVILGPEIFETNESIVFRLRVFNSVGKSSGVTRFLDWFSLKYFCTFKSFVNKVLQL